MKYYLHAFFILFSFSVIAQLKAVNSPFPNPGNISGYIYLSKKTDVKPNAPLVVVLHGCTQDAQEISMNTEWNRLADSLGFHVLYPEQNKRNNLSNCFNWFQANDNEKDKGELYSIERMIREPTLSYSIDTTKIYVYGVSAGAGMAVALLVNYPSLFNSGAILAGIPYGEIKSASDVARNNLRPADLSPDEWEQHARNCNPNYSGKFPNIIIMHGTNDYIVPITAGYELCEQFMALHDVNKVPSQRIQSFKSVNGLNRSSFTKDNKEVIVFYEMVEWGHAIMVKPGNCSDCGGMTDTYSKEGGLWSTLQIVEDWGIIAH